MGNVYRRSYDFGRKYYMNDNGIIQIWLKLFRSTLQIKCQRKRDANKEHKEKPTITNFKPHTHGVAYKKMCTLILENFKSHRNFGHFERFLPSLYLVVLNFLLYKIFLSSTEKTTLPNTKLRTWSVQSLLQIDMDCTGLTSVSFLDAS